LLRDIILMSPNEAIEEIVKRFVENVKGKRANLTGSNIKHDGREGHWLEKQMGITPNANNDADILGFEMKKQTRAKTTFGDWSADYYIFKDPKYKLDRDNGFLPIFGKANIKKENRYSWSGEPCPNVHGYNSFGQKLLINHEEDILAIYSFPKDSRVDKNKFVLKKFREENLTIAKWHKESLKNKLESKFNQKGWFRCEKNSQGVYISIAIGAPISWEKWIAHVKTGEVYFDSGMYQGNKRNYSQWRANNSFWDNLIIQHRD